MNNRPNPHLAPPGAGVPTWQVLLVRSGLPILPLLLPPKTAAARAAALRDDLIGLVRELGEARARERVLIRPLMHLEDSSRHWSASMVLEHLAIVCGGVADVISRLVDRTSIDALPGTADVKPTGGLTADESTDRLREADAAYQASVQKLIEASPLPKPRALAPHPWFGRLDAVKWSAFEPLHRNVHRRQLARIARGLDDA